jgi:hypothetical protein
MSVGYGDVGEFGGDGSCAVCVVAGGSVGCGHCTCLSANDAEAAVFVEYEGADLGCGAVVAVAASGKRRSSEFGVRAWGGKLGVCSGVDSESRVEFAKMVYVIPICLALFLFLSFRVLSW